MATELRPLGVRCNISCRYCYQEPTRGQLGGVAAYDIDKMLASAEEIGAPITVFGGEPLLLPVADLERLFAAGRDRLGGVSIQTNGTLITDAHIALFRAYDVRVGVSVDGPGELNELRWAHSADRTRTASEASLQAIARLCAEGLTPSVIVTLHKANATAERLPRLLEWMRDVDGRGVRFVRLHLLESESRVIRETYGLSETETTRAMLAFLSLEQELTSVRFDIFMDIRAGLDPSGQGATTCIWSACDPYTTAAVQGVEGDGSRSNCGRTNKEGIEFLKADTPSYERYLALYYTPQEHGGCHGCRFFALCKGQSPGTALDGDWRNRTEHCASWFAVMEHVERELLAKGTTPLSLDEHRPVLEAAMISAWEAGRNASPASIVRQQSGGLES